VNAPCASFATNVGTSLADILAKKIIITMDIKGGWHMKKSLMRTGLVLLLMIGLASNAAALPIVSGALSMSGNLSTVPSGSSLSAATGFAFSAISATTGTGDFSSLAGQSLTMPGFSFNPFAPDSELWYKLGFVGKDYHFYMSSLSIDTQTDKSLQLSGLGYADVSGFERGYGEWILTANSLGSTFSWSASTATVPEPLTLILFGAGLLGLFGLRRKLS
jgi:hypothetical protein